MNQNKTLENYLDTLLSSEDMSLSHQRECIEEGVETTDESGVTTVSSLAADTESASFANLSVVAIPTQDKELINLPEKEARQNDNILDIVPFTVVGLNLALPADKVLTVLDWRDDISFSSNVNSVVLGTFSYNGKMVSLIDSAVLVVPKTHPQYDVMISRKNYRHILILNDERTAITCDSIHEHIELERENVQWRSVNTTHPWLAGTILDYEIALIAPAKLIEILRENYKA